MAEPKSFCTYEQQLQILKNRGLSRMSRWLSEGSQNHRLSRWLEQALEGHLTGKAP